MAKKKLKPSKKAATQRAGHSPAPKRSGSEPRVLQSPDYSGPPSKLKTDCFPEDATPKDFVCYGPAATSDGQFETFRICDMGCFRQDGQDTNKYYHGAVVQHRKSKNWYAYFEWGRTGGTSFSFQFVACQSEEDARVTFAKQLHTKNDKRGQWVTIAGVRTLQAKPKKDCYLVRPMATRTTGLPGARKIVSHKKSRPKPAKNPNSPPPQADPKSITLLKDLSKATIAYTRKNMADSSIPTQGAIDEARAILAEASSRVGEVEADALAQASDKTLMKLTRLMFGRIPRKKKVGAPASTWVLSQSNIQNWYDDLDAFESALHAVAMEGHTGEDLLHDMNMEMKWLEPDSKVGEFIHNWLPKATVDNHQKIKQIEIKNIWDIRRHHSRNFVEKSQKRILRGKVNLSEKPKGQPRARLDLPTKARRDFKQSNTALLFHGTRGVNVNAILRESLRMPDTLVAVAITGAKFGPGIYFSDDWKKCADYTNAKGSKEAGRTGAVRGRKAFMFAADVVLGSVYVAPEVHGYTKAPRGYHSVFGKSGHSGVDDNEFIIYKSDQFDLRYLIEFETGV